MRGFPRKFYASKISSYTVYPLIVPLHFPQDEMEMFQQILCTILNFAYDATNLPMFDSCNIVQLLLTFARCPHFESALLSRIILSFLTPLLANEEWLALKLDDVETRYFISTLQKAIVSSDQEAEGYSVLELLKIISCFTNSCCGLPLGFKEHISYNQSQALTSEESNKISSLQYELIEHSKMMEENVSLLIEADILFTLEQLIQTASEELIAAVALLLWNLLHFAPVKQLILKYHASIVPSLHGFLKSSQDAIQQAVSCVLYLMETVEGMQIAIERRFKLGTINFSRTKQNSSAPAINGLIY